MRQSMNGSLVAVLAALAISAIGFGARAAETTIGQKDLKFIPSSVTIHVGDAVRFTNSDSFHHDVTIIRPDGTPDDKGLVEHGEEFAMTFITPGTYKVRCRLHPHMAATIIVK
jgi:plastocyanin